jgi:hypothetical protein
VALNVNLASQYLDGGDRMGGALNNLIIGASERKSL